MDDPKLNHKRAFHYALEQMKALAQDSLRELSDEELFEVAVATGLLKLWVEEVFYLERQGPVWSERAL